jgi:chromosome segregation ATPase
MWTKLFEFTKDILTLQRDKQQNKADIKEAEQEIKRLNSSDENLRSDFNKLVLLVQELSHRIEKIDEREQSERREMALRLENEMLKFERRLPRSKDELTFISIFTLWRPDCWLHYIFNFRFFGNNVSAT